jgi:hypothetical protein
MRPVVVLKYRLEHLWSTAARAATDYLPHIENTTATDAFDVSISSVIFDRDRRVDFDPVPALPAHGSWTLGVHPSPISLAAAISRTIVDDVLAGRGAARRWPVRICYRDEDGRQYATCCEIRVVRLPLAIDAAVIPCGDAAFSERPSPTRSPAELAAGRY